MRAAFIAMLLGIALIAIPVGQDFQRPVFEMAGWISLFAGTVTVGLLQLSRHRRGRGAQ
jgi:hypothetical protein